METATADTSSTSQTSTEPVDAENQRTPGMGDTSGFKTTRPAAKPQGTAGQLNAKAAKPGDHVDASKPAGVKDDKAPEVKPEKRKFQFKTKVDGVESEEEYDEDSLVRELQMAKAANKRMQESARKAKDAEELQNAFKNGDEKRLRELGIDPDEWAARRLTERAKMLEVPAEQREMEQLRKEAEHYKNLHSQREQQEQLKAQEAEDQRAWEELQPQFIKELQTRELPADVATMQLIASVGLEFADAGIDLTPAQVVAEVEKRQGSRIERYMLKNFKENPDNVVKFLTKHGLIDAVRKSLDKQWSEKTGIKAPPKKEETDVPKGPIKHNPDSKPMSDAEWLRSVRGR